MVSQNYNFGDLLRQLRHSQKVSQTQLAKMLDVSQDTVSLWERGKSLPDFLSIRNLAIVFDVSADYILGLSDY